MTLTPLLSADVEAALIVLISEHHGQADQAVERPLADWSQWLESKGYGADGLESFFLNPDLLQDWQGETSLTALYGRAITEGQTTGQFIDALSELEPAYLEHTVEAADLLLAKSAELLATAGGTGHGLNRTNLSSGAKWGIRATGLLVGGSVCGVAGFLLFRKLRNSDAVNPEKIANGLEKDALGNAENQVRDVFGGKSDLEVAEILAKKDLEIQAKKFHEVSEKIENKTREGFDDYERNHKVLLETIEKCEKNKAMLMDAFTKDSEKALEEQKNELRSLQDNPLKLFKSEYNLEFQNSKYGKKLHYFVDSYTKTNYTLADFQRGFNPVAGEDAAWEKARNLHGPELVKAFTDEKIQALGGEFESNISEYEAVLNNDLRETLGNISKLIKTNEQNKLATEINDETGVLFDTAEQDALKIVEGAAKDAEQGLVTEVDGLEDELSNID